MYISECSQSAVNMQNPPECCFCAFATFQVRALITWRRYCSVLERKNGFNVQHISFLFDNILILQTCTHACTGAQTVIQRPQQLPLPKALLIRIGIWALAL